MTADVPQDDCAMDKRRYDRKISEVEEAFDRKLKDHEAREHERLSQMIDTLKAEAFPDGTHNHRAAHQIMIDKAKAEAEFLRWLKIEIAKKSIWGILQILALLVTAGLVAKFGSGIIK